VIETRPIHELSLSCPSCAHGFERLWSTTDGRVFCPACSAPICPCGCSADLSRMKADALYGSEACRKRLERAGNPDRTRTGIRSGNVRSVEQAGELHETFKDQWCRRIRQRIVRALDEHGEYHADYIADLLVPAAYVNCIGSQVRALSHRKVMVKTGEWRTNKAAASNSRPSPVWRYAAGGRREFDRYEAELSTAGPSADVPPEGAGPNRAQAHVSAGSGGEDSPGGALPPSAPPVPGESPARLFDDAPPSQYDPYSEAA
jgi:hypothetical protein